MDLKPVIEGKIEIVRQQKAAAQRTIGEGMQIIAETARKVEIERERVKLCDGALQSYEDLLAETANAETEQLTGDAAGPSVVAMDPAANNGASRARRGRTEKAAKPDSGA